MVHPQADVPSLPLSFPFASCCLRTPGLCSSPCPPADEVCPLVQGRDRSKTRAMDTRPQLDPCQHGRALPHLSLRGLRPQSNRERMPYEQQKVLSHSSGSREVPHPGVVTVRGLARAASWFGDSRPFAVSSLVVRPLSQGHPSRSRELHSHELITPPKTPHPSTITLGIGAVT